MPLASREGTDREVGGVTASSCCTALLVAALGGQHRSPRLARRRFSFGRTSHS
jgi:hypothetical protein